MSEFETIVVDKRDWVGTITMNRPERLNAMTVTMLVELAQAFRQMEDAADVRVVVLTGAGDAFSVGADIKESGKRMQAGTDRAADQAGHSRAIAEVPRAMRRVSKPIIASINGLAVGGGMTITLHCDVRIASNTARFGAVFARMGVTPEFGSTYTLPRIVGIAKACELVFTARVFGAEEAMDIGLVHHLVAADALRDTTSEMASTIAKLPPFAVRLAKRGVYQGLDTNLEAQLDWEMFALEAALHSADHAEAVKAFLEKREPRFGPQ